MGFLYAVSHALLPDASHIPQALSHNSWQPVGKSARAGEKLLVYVGHNTKKWGEAANLQIVFTQNHSDRCPFFSGLSIDAENRNIAASIDTYRIFIIGVVSGIADIYLSSALYRTGTYRWNCNFISADFQILA